MENRKKILMKLFVSTLYLSAFTFGGGYVIVTLMKKKFVDEYHWIEENEMLDLVAIAQSAPGPIAVNGAIVVGYKLAGMTGVVTAIIGTIIPPFLVSSDVYKRQSMVSQKAAILSNTYSDKIILVADAVKGDAATVNSWVAETKACLLYTSRCV